MSHDYVLNDGTEISHFRIESRLGAGGMGEVYKAHDLTLDRPSAMKVLSPEFLTDADRVRRFVQEARSASALNHPNIVTIYEIGQVPVSKRTLGYEEDGELPIHFIAMEFIDGLTLRSLASRGTETTKLLDVMAQVADGLAKAHGEGIVHRDLKPDNIMITNDGYAKVVDFGLAKLTESKGRADQHRTASGVVMGTAAYMSPEQVQGLDIDRRSDIFSYGAILYELLCGRRPFQSESSIDTMHRIVFSDHTPLQDIVPWMPEALCQIVDCCLAKEPDDRYPDTKQIAVDLRQVIRSFEAGAVASGQPPIVSQQPGYVTPGSGPGISGPGAGQRPGSGAQYASGARGPTGTQPGSVAVPVSGGYQHASGGLSISGGFVAADQSAPADVVLRRRINFGAWIYRTVLFVLLALAGFLWYGWPDFAPVEALPLEETPAIQQAQSDGPVAWSWLPFDKISPALKKSVVEEMDPDFFAPAIGTKQGNEALNDAAKGAKLGSMPKRVAGMSPIARGAVRWGMLSPRSLLSSIEAVAYAIGLERTISRESTLEILLNTVEFKEGVFGVEAATQAYFQKSARSLSPEEAAILAVFLHYPEETSIENPDNLAVARRDKLIEKVSGRKSGGGGSDSSGGAAAAGSNSASPPAESVEPTEPEPAPESAPDTTTQEEELPMGSTLPDV